jgi:hypothetical protein
MHSLRGPGLFGVQIALFAMAAIAGCTPFSEIQSARLVGEGEFEVTPSISSVSGTFDDETNHMMDNMGVQCGIGVGPSMDLRVRYEQVGIDSDSRADDPTVNFISFGPKLSIEKDRAAFYLPMWIAYGENVSDSAETWSVHPTLIFTRQINNNFEWNPSIKAIIPLGRNDSDSLLACNCGFGFSSDLRTYVIRPEFGFLFNPGEDGHLTQFSLGVTFYP